MQDYANNRALLPQIWVYMPYIPVITVYLRVYSGNKRYFLEINEINGGMGKCTVFPRYSRYYVKTTLRCIFRYIRDIPEINAEIPILGILVILGEYPRNW